MQCNTYWRHMKRHLSPCKRLSPLTICRCSKHSIMMSTWYLFQASMTRHNLTLESAQDGSFMCSTLTSFLRPGYTQSFLWLSPSKVGFVPHKAGCLLSRDMLTRYKELSHQMKMSPRWWSWSPAYSKGGTASTCHPATSPPASSSSAPFLWSPLIQTVPSNHLLLLLYPYHLPARVLFSINIMWNNIQSPPTAGNLLKFQDCFFIRPKSNHHFVLSETHCHFIPFVKFCREFCEKHLAWKQIGLKPESGDTCVSGALVSWIRDGRIAAKIFEIS